jgi:hypothetical protein
MFPFLVDSSVCVVYNSTYLRFLASWISLGASDGKIVI